MHCCRKRAPLIARPGALRRKAIWRLRWWLLTGSWRTEHVFQQVTETFGLQSPIGGTPETTIFQFSFCLLLYNVMQTIRGFVAKNQKRECESISIENLFHDTREELTTLSVLIRRGVICVDDIPPRQSDVQRQLNDLLQNQWSDRWIKKKQKLTASRASLRKTNSLLLV